MGDLLMVRAGLVKSDFLMRSLGRPNRDQIVTSRPADLTTLEAIDLSNGETLSQALHSGAQQYADSEVSDRELVHRIFIAALTRPPTSEELSVCLDALRLANVEGEDELAARELVVEDLLWAVFMMPEFIMIR